MKADANQPTDAGSALPLMIAGVLFLILFGATLMGSVQLLEQQRRLNGVSDTLALDLTQEHVASPTRDARQLTAFAGEDLMAIYPERSVQIGQIRVLSATSVAVTLCEEARPTLASVLGMAARQVCAQSRAAQSRAESR